MVRQHLEAPSLPPWRDATLFGQRLAHAFLDVSVVDTRRARRLAAAALHTGVHEFHELGGDRCVVEMHGPNGCDSPTRRQRFLTRDAKRRAVRKAQSAADAGGQLLVVQVEFHVGSP
jgi:hypothetical protein